MTNAKILIDILLNKNEELSDRENALIYLGDYEDDFIEDALIKLIKEANDDFNLKNDACETLVMFWIKKINIILKK